MESETTACLASSPVSDPGDANENQDGKLNKYIVSSRNLLQDRVHGTMESFLYKYGKFIAR